MEADAGSLPDVCVDLPGKHSFTLMGAVPTRKQPGRRSLCNQRTVVSQVDLQEGSRGSVQVVLQWLAIFRASPGHANDHARLATVRDTMDMLVEPQHHEVRDPQGRRQPHL